MAQFGLTDGEAALLRRMTPPWRIQERLDAMDRELKAVLQAVTPMLSTPGTPT